jgi:tetratricopeptide (TPR) repeat protein
MFLTACGPPGARDLRQGETAIKAGEYETAIARLNDATHAVASASPTAQAKAWNLLGLAYQGAGQLDPASQAYLKALKLDHNLQAADYNLGCVRMSQNNFPGAIDYFTTFVSLNPRGVNGYLKLGAARYHLALEKTGAEKARQLENARRDFEAAEKLAPTAEGANAIGMLEMQRRNGGMEAARTAAADFQAAIERDAHYGPALLNLAVINQQHLNQLKTALQYYLQYLALQPMPPHAKEVAKLAQQLNLDSRITIGADAGGNPAAPRVVSPPANPAPAAPKAAPAEPHSAKVTKPAPVIEPSKENQVAAVPAQAPSPPPTPPPKTNQPAPVSAPPVEAVSSTPASVPATNELSIPQPVVPPPASVPQKSSSHKFNPFRWLSGKSTDSTDNPPAAKFARYKYPPRVTPIPGNRTEAERLAGLGAQERQEGHLEEALRDYQEATEADSTYFDAGLAQGLTAVDAVDYDTALDSLYRALALRENSADARYAFAWVLQKRGFYVDAANELEKLLSAHPKEARGHLLLGNLDAEKLGKIKQARQHYAKVLELDPGNSQAAAIRAWILKTP